MVNEPNFNELRDEGCLPVDHPARKLAIFPSTAGQVVLLSSEAGMPLQCTVLEPGEVASVCASLLRAAAHAAPLREEYESAYQAFLAIEKAKEACR